MGTENAVMAAVLAEGQTVLVNAACEPHVQDLCRFLVSLGAQIDGIGSNVLRIDGRRAPLRRRAPDRARAHRGGELHRARRGDRRRRHDRGRRARRLRRDPRTRSSGSGSRSSSARRSSACPPGQELVIRDDLGDQIPKIEDGPWPAFPADLTSIALAVATQARGTILIFEKMFENRLFFVDKLVRMGARIILCDPHRAVVTGPARLHGAAAREPGHPGRDGDDHRRALRRGHLGDRQHRPDRPRLRADRRAAPRARRLDRAHLTAAGYPPPVGTAGRTRRRSASGSRSARAPSISTGPDACSTTSRRARPDGAAPALARGRAGRRRPGGRRRRPGAGRGHRAAPAGAGGRRPRLRVAAGRRGARRRGARGLRPAARRLERRLLAASAGSRSDVVAVFLEELAAGRRAERPHPRPRGQGSPERAERDLQGARRGHRPGVPHAGRRSAMSKQVVRTEQAPGAVPGRAVQPGDRRERVRVRRRPARRSIPARRRSSRAGSARRPSACSRTCGAILEAAGSSLDARRQDDRLPHEPRRLRRDERGLRARTSATRRPRGRPSRSGGSRPARSSRSRRSHSPEHGGVERPERPCWNTA